MVTLEPTPDSDDMYPGWLANGRDWARELQVSMDVPVILEVLHESIGEAVATDVDGVLVAELLWRDSSLPRD